jgi:hypothetical protein
MGESLGIPRQRRATGELDRPDRRRTALEEPPDAKLCVRKELIPVADADRVDGLKPENGERSEPEQRNGSTRRIGYPMHDAAMLEIAVPRRG